MEQQSRRFHAQKVGRGRRRVSIKDEYVGALAFTASVVRGIAAELSTKANR